VDLVGDRGGAEDNRRGPAPPAVGREDQRREDRDDDEPRDRERVRQLLLHPHGYGRSRHRDRVFALPRPTPPGFVNAHSHAFQRALRGRTEGGDFWAWREAMLGLARGQTPDSVKASYVTTYAEMLHSGYTAVGEFHYLGFDAAVAAADAAAEAG